MVLFESKILDVGCGNRPMGDVNLDFKEQRVPNFIKGDATNLPFDDNSFTTVYSSGLSLWKEEFHDDLLLKAWKEAIRVATDQVIFEYNFIKGHKKTKNRDPLKIIKWLREEISPNIKLSYSERGKLFPIIHSFEIIFGKRITIKIVNAIFKRSYLVKYQLKLSNKNFPETINNLR